MEPKRIEPNRCLPVIAVVFDAWHPWKGMFEVWAHNYMCVLRSKSNSASASRARRLGRHAPRDPQKPVKPHNT